MRERDGLEAPSHDWVGQCVKIEDLPAFKEKWGLRTVNSEWLEGEACPTVFFKQTETGIVKNGR